MAKIGSLWNCSWRGQPMNPLLTKEGARGRLLTRSSQTSPDPSFARRGTLDERFIGRSPLLPPVSRRVLSRQNRQSLVVAVLFVVLPLFAACGESDPGFTNSGRLDLSRAMPADFVAHGSIEELYVTDATAGTELELARDDGSVVQTATADDQGMLIFRNVAPAAGYVVASGSGADLRAAAPVTVTSTDDTPDPSLYQQQIGSGYGYLRTRDGTTLAINVIFPKGPGPYPTVIEYSGYAAADPDSPQPSTQLAATLGYAAVGVNMRGTGCSGGAFEFFDPPQLTDGYDAVETIAAQPWVKGNKVGMVGISYPGISQLFVAQLQPPHLAAIAPLSIIADTFRGTLYPGGILNNGFAVQWAMDRQHDAQPGGQPWSQKRLDAGDPICIANQKLRGQTPDLLMMIHDNPFYTPAVGDPLAPATFVNRIKVPVFLAGAWQDEQTGPYFATMLDRFTGTTKLHFTLVNGGHADSLDPAIFTRWAEFLSFYVAEEIPKFPANAIVTLELLAQQIFGVQHVPVESGRFTGAPSLAAALAQYEAEPPVRILFDSGAGAQPGSPVPGFEQSFDRWPIPALQPTIWYFAEGGRLDTPAPVDNGADTFIYDTSAAQRTTFSGNGNDVWKALPAWDWRPPDPGKAVAYATDPLTETMVMAGSGSVDLWLKSTVADVDLQVTLSEIRPDGQETYVQCGWLRASQRKLDAAASTLLRPVQTHLQADAAELPAGQFVEARVELFPFAHVFRTGSRIRITVDAPGGSRPLWQFDDLTADGQVINTIGRSAAAPSRVVLPVVPGVEVTTPLPPCPGLRGQPCRAFVEFTNTPG
jgi:predicted acyl esterase